MPLKNNLNNTTVPPILMNDYLPRLQEMKQLMIKAAKIHVLPLKGNVSNSSAKQKQDHSSDYLEPVTQADINSSNYILKRIRPTLPGSYSEEDLGDNLYDHDILWQIDPVDGTQEFIDGVPFGSAMHAALLVRQKDGSYKPEAGLIYVFESGEMFYATSNTYPVYEVNGFEQKLASPISNKILGSQRLVDPNQVLDEFYKGLGQKLDLPHEIYHDGGAGATIAKLIKGERNLYIMNRSYTKEWDVSMAEPLIQGLGGRISDIHGNPLDYNRKDHFNRNGFIVSVGLNHDKIIEAVLEFEKIKPLIVPVDKSNQ